MATIEQLTRDRDAERNATRLEREQRERTVQEMAEELRNARSETERVKEAYRNAQRELEEQRDQINQVKMFMERGKMNPFGSFTSLF